MIIENGEKLSVDGTSASTPVTAGIIALINDARLNNNQSPLGFINPSLYAMAASNFNDVTFGNNTGTEANGIGGKDYCFTYGYGASAGWDPCVSINIIKSLIILLMYFILNPDWFRNTKFPTMERIL